MFSRGNIKTLGLGILLVLVVLMTTRCAVRTSPELPKDILGISVGMDKADARKRLEEIAQFERDERKAGEVWRMKNDPRFSHIAVAYDADRRIRFVTTFVDKATAKERIRFSDVGDITKAKQEIMPPHYRYIWEIPAADGKPALSLNIYGDNPESLTIYTISKIVKPGEAKETEEEDE